MTTEFDDEIEAINAERERKFVQAAHSLIKSIRDSDRLVGHKEDKATPIHQRPSLKSGKHVRRDPSFHLADLVLDLEKALKEENHEDARILYYQIKRLS